jgi:hypothetical protein
MSKLGYFTVQINWIILVNYSERIFLSEYEVTILLSCPLRHFVSIREGDHVIAFNAKMTLITLTFHVSIGRLAPHVSLLNIFLFNRSFLGVGPCFALGQYGPSWLPGASSISHHCWASS